MRGLLVCVLAVAAVSAQQQQTEAELNAQLGQALQHRDGQHALIAMVRLNELYHEQRNWAAQSAEPKNIFTYWSKAIGANSIGVTRYSTDLAEAQEKAGNLLEAEGHAQSAIAIFEKHADKYAAAGTRARRVLYSILKQEGRTSEAAALENTLSPEITNPMGQAARAAIQTRARVFDACT